MDAYVQARLLAYIAYMLGRTSVSRGSTEEDALLIRSCLNGLENRPRTEETLRRQLFYTLILAELYRLSDPIPGRESAKEFGQQLERMGFPNPFPLYMQIIKATTRPLTTGNFGDIKTPGAELIRDASWYVDQFGNVTTNDLALWAVELSDSDLTAASGAFFGKSLREIARLHGLA